MDAPGDRIPVEEYMRNEARFRVVEKLDPEAFRRYAARAQSRAERRVAIYRHISELRFPVKSAGADGGEPARVESEGEGPPPPAEGG